MENKREVWIWKRKEERKKKKNLKKFRGIRIRKWSRSRKDRISCRTTTSFLRTDRRDHWHSRDERSAAIINHSSPKQRQKTDNRDVDGLRIPTSGSWTKTLTRGKKVRTVPKNSSPYSRYTERAPPRKEKEDGARSGSARGREMEDMENVHVWSEKKKREKKKSITDVAVTWIVRPLFSLVLDG